MIAAVGVYGLFCSISVLEELAKRQTLGWDSRPFYMFVVPTSAFAITLYLSSRRKHHQCREVAVEEGRMVK